MGGVPRVSSSRGLVGFKEGFGILASRALTVVRCRRCMHLHLKEPGTVLQSGGQIEGGAEPAHRVPSGNGCRFRLSLFAAERVYGQIDHTYVIAASWKPCWLVSLLQSAGASGQEDGLEVGDGPFSIHQKSKGTTHFGRESTSWPLDSGRMKRRLHDFGGCRLASPVPSRAGSFHGSGFASRWHGLVDPGLQPGCLLERQQSPALKLFCPLPSICRNKDSKSYPILLRFPTARPPSSPSSLRRSNLVASPADPQQGEIGPEIPRV